MPQILTAEELKRAIVNAPKRPHLAEYPLKGNYLDWVNGIGETLWEESGLDTLIKPMLALNCDRLICDPPQGNGWFQRTLDDWVKVEVDDLPSAMIVDVESKEVNGRWEAFLCVALAESEGKPIWYMWQGKGLIPSQPGTLFIGHNASAHDSQFFESEYLPVGVDKTAWLDSRALCEILRGIHPDNRAQYIKFRAKLDSGKGGVPEWVGKACDANLPDAVQSFCGIAINKSVGGDLFSGETAPKSVFEYCCQDVWATLMLLKTVYPMAKGAIKSPVWWWGQLAITGLRVDASGWDESLKEIRDLYEEAKAPPKVDRAAWQKNIVKWGASHLTRFSDATVNNGVLALRVQPCNVLGQLKSDWATWSTLEGEDAWDCEPDREFAVPLVSLGIENGKDSIDQVVFPLPMAPKVCKDIAQSLAQSPLVESKYLKVRCPASIVGTGLKTDWLRQCDQGDVLMMFIAIMDAFIIEYELDAWLTVPGMHHVMYSCRGEEKSEQLEKCGAEAARIIWEILK